MQMKEKESKAMEKDKEEAIPQLERQMKTDREMSGKRDETHRKEEEGRREKGEA